MGKEEKDMTFSADEFVAIMYVAKAMAMADDKVEKTELSVIVNELRRFGIDDPGMADIFFKTADKIDAATALSLISKMDDEQKTYVAAYLGSIMCIDQDINETEMALWKMVCSMCGLPAMTAKQALEIMASL